ncbi:hypothetical protein [uncultured Clostridium sp.]|uniref:hypothetical protein n=1 Tax=uncultured Clostridium sp. TaxID=59620 RepID=UPI00272B1551|nr:hypothetical protein [uncultured Clostridium sp.]
MRSYSNQYKKYYQELQSKNLGKNSPVYKRNTFESVYESDMKKNKKKDFFSSMANVFIYQLVVVIFMFMAAFYLKYSPNEQNSYKNVKAVMNDKTYSIENQEIEVLNFSEILNKISNYIKTSLNGGKADF